MAHPAVTVADPLQVVHIQRRPLPTQFSVEGYFERVRQELSDEFKLIVHVLPCFSRGLWGRVRNILSAVRNQGVINHVTGDVHYATLLLPRHRTVLTVLDCQVLERLKGWRRSVVRLLWYTLPVRHASVITVISEETKRQLLREISFPPDRIVVIPVSVSPLFQPSPRPFNSECPRILQVGTKANKNVERLADALRDVRCRLDIVGPVNDVLRRRLELNQVQFREYGRLTDEQIVECYRESDIISFVSTHEGFGMPIVEAQSVERVCVTSNCSSMPEVAGDGACLVDPFDVNSIREGFQRVIGDAQFRETLLERGRENRKRFSPAAIADRFAAVYRCVAGFRDLNGIPG